MLFLAVPLHYGYLLGFCVSSLEEIKKTELKFSDAKPILLIMLFMYGTNV